MARGYLGRRSRHILLNQRRSETARAKRNDNHLLIMPAEQTRRIRTEVKECTIKDLLDGQKAPRPFLTITTVTANSPKQLCGLLSTAIEDLLPLDLKS